MKDYGSNKSGGSKPGSQGSYEKTKSGTNDPNMIDSRAELIKTYKTPIPEPSDYGHCYTNNGKINR